jgi:rubrerythrin
MASYLNCLSQLEYNTSLLYKSLSERTEIPLGKSLLLSIAQDSSKHSALLKGIADSILVTKVKTKECAKNLGQIWQIVDTCLAEVTKGAGEISFTDLHTKLLALEGSMGEEYYVFVQMETLQHLTGEIKQRYNLDFGDLKSVFENIISDENHHREIIATLRELVTPEEKDLDNTPLVKYQSPDQWINYNPHNP